MKPGGQLCSDPVLFLTYHPITPHLPGRRCPIISRYESAISQQIALESSSSRGVKRSGKKRRTVSAQNLVSVARNTLTPAGL